MLTFAGVPSMKVDKITDFNTKHSSFNLGLYFWPVPTNYTWKTGKEKLEKMGAEKKSNGGVINISKLHRK